ncbi:hypothetical protein Bca4012_083946 [Brassica carinata]
MGKRSGPCGSERCWSRSGNLLRRGTDHAIRTDDILKKDRQAMGSSTDAWDSRELVGSVTGSGALSMASVLSVLDGWLKSKPSLFVLGHVGMVG